MHFTTLWDSTSTRIIDCNLASSNPSTQTHSKPLSFQTTTRELLLIQSQATTTVCFSTAMHHLSLRDTKPTFRIQCQPDERKSHGHFLIARKRTRQDTAANVTLSVDNTTSITFGLDSKTTEWKERRSTEFAANFCIAAANTCLKRVMRVV